MTTATMATSTPTLPADYVERVYAGVLGKLIGVYLGRPVESWTYDRITAEHGEVDRYIHESRGMPLVVTDDDISGTFTFLRVPPGSWERSSSHSGTDWQHVAQLSHRATDDPVVGRDRQLDRAHRVSPAEKWHSGAGQWLDGAQWQDGCRADWLADLH